MVLSIDFPFTTFHQRIQRSLSQLKSTSALQPLDLAPTYGLSRHHAHPVSKRLALSNA
jgi:hypothetical protein